jgi:hypothetical protein
MKLGVAGNCQATVLAQCLERLYPSVQLVVGDWARITSPGHAEPLARELATCDVVFSQVTKNPAFGALQTDQLAGRARQLLRWPKLNFSGFHPDMIGYRPVRTPVGAGHSAIILAGFLMGSSPGRTRELFNAYVYGLLGYYDEYPKAEAFLLQAARSTDTPLDEDLPRWRGQGVFMHVPPHPVIGVLWSLAQQVGERLGLGSGAASGLPADPLAASMIWPVYPEIANRLGLQGSLLFKPSGEGEAPVDLDQMIEGSFRAYAAADPRLLQLSQALVAAEALKQAGV